MKVCLYTAIYGDYEILSSHNPAITGVDFKCFTDNTELKSNFWDLTHVPNHANIPEALFYKKIKCCPDDYISEDYDVTIWLDANFIIKDTDYINRLINQISDKDMLLYKHRCLAKKPRDCIYTEAMYSMTLPDWVYGDEELKRQINDYKQDQYPTGNGLYQSGLMVRKHNDERVKQFNSFWLDQIHKYGKRRPQCQVSLPYSMWKTDINFDSIDGDIWDTNIFEIKKHGTVRQYSPAYK